VAADLEQPAPRELLTAAELQSVSHCAAKRIQDFAAGRLCARRALQEFGIVGFSLLSAPDRQPIWPTSMVGSITHTEGYSAAVAGRGGRIRGLGVDSESVRSVHEELWSRICNAAELERLRTLPADRALACAALTFAAKEAFYKAQFPLTGEWIEFEEVTIEAAHWEGSAGSFEVLPQREVRVQACVGAPFTGRFRFHTHFVTAGIAL